MDTLIASAFAGLEDAQPENREAVEAMLDKFGLRWNVTKEPLVIEGDTGSIATPYYAIVREDTSKCLYNCRGTYVPFQNSELAELLYRVCEKTGYTLHSGGSLEGGKKVYLQMDSLAQMVGLGKNYTTVKGYVTGINSHDGTTKLKWGAVNFTVCCKNTFLYADSLLSNQHRHSASIKEEVEISVQNVLALQKANEKLFDTYRKMASAPLGKKTMEHVIEMVSGVDMTDESENKYSSKLVKKAERLLSAITAETNQKGNTLWGLFSGVTAFTTHIMSVRESYNTRLSSKYVGGGFRVDNQVFDYLTSIIQ